MASTPKLYDVTVLRKVRYRYAAADEEQVRRDFDPQIPPAAAPRKLTPLEEADLQVKVVAVKRVGAEEAAEDTVENASAWIRDIGEEEDFDYEL